MQEFDESVLKWDYKLTTDLGEVRLQLWVHEDLVERVKGLAEDYFCDIMKMDEIYMINGTERDMAGFMAAIGYLRAHYPDSLH